MLSKVWQYKPGNKIRAKNINIRLKSSAQDPDLDPLDLQDFGFLDPDPQKYANPRIRFQGTKNEPKTATT